MMLLWQLTAIRPTGDGWYRWSVQGFNVETGQAFSWAVPSISEGFLLPVVR